MINWLLILTCPLYVGAGIIEFVMVKGEWRIGVACIGWGLINLLLGWR